MKIRRLNESKRDDFYDFLSRQQKLKGEKRSYCAKIDEYLKLNKDKWQKWHLNGYSSIHNFSLYEGKNVYFEIEYLNRIGDDFDTFDLNGQEYNDFLEFLDNPELYSSVKKYNL